MKGKLHPLSQIRAHSLLKFKAPTHSVHFSVQTHAFVASPNNACTELVEDRACPTINVTNVLVCLATSTRPGVCEL